MMKMRQLYLRFLTRTIRASSSSSSSASPSRCNLPWLMIGLGNPGSKFKGTRHHIGFEMIDAIAKAEGIPLRTLQHRALLGKGYTRSAPVLLAKPLASVNLSGESKCLHQEFPTQSNFSRHYHALQGPTVP